MLPKLLKKLPQVYLAETVDEHCQVITDIKEAFLGGIRDELSFKEIAAKIRAADARAKSADDEDGE